MKKLVVLFVLVSLRAADDQNPLISAANEFVLHQVAHELSHPSRCIIQEPVVMIDNAITRENTGQRRFSCRPSDYCSACGGIACCACMVGFLAASFTNAGCTVTSAIAFPTGTLGLTCLMFGAAYEGQISEYNVNGQPRQ